MLSFQNNGVDSKDEAVDIQADLSGVLSSTSTVFVSAALASEACPKEVYERVANKPKQLDYTGI